MNLNAIKQAELSQKTMELQRKDAELAFHRNEGIKRLNIVSIMYLPATFIAVSLPDHLAYTSTLTCHPDRAYME